MRSKIYIWCVGLCFAALLVVMVALPRSSYSELEKRDLAVFPAFTVEKLKDGSFTKEVSSWFSDTEPHRDVFMMISMKVKECSKLKVGGDTELVFHASETSQSVEPEPVTEEEEGEAEELQSEADRKIGKYNKKVSANENAKIANAGILIIGSGDKVRALMAYGGSASGGVAYANVANKYKETFGSKVNVYCTVVPTAIEFYCPDNARRCTKDQRATINNIFSHLNPEVKAVDIYTTLGEHADEGIFLRTDHHWSPLGGYYAAKKFASIAGVPFKELTRADGSDAVSDIVPYKAVNEWYKMKVTHGYVGSMYASSGDVSVKEAPEDFTYFVPTKVDYTTTYINYTVDKSYHVTGAGKPFVSKFFMHYGDGNGGAYCTFMGGDAKITAVRTSVNNGRRLMILKDSFGNVIPGWLFYSFEEVHVIDYRYFLDNMVKYVSKNKITDILFANNVFSAYSSSTANNYKRFLTQGVSGSGEKKADEQKKDVGAEEKTEAVK